MEAIIDREVGDDDELQGVDRKGGGGGGSQGWENAALNWREEGYNCLFERR